MLTNPGDLLFEMDLTTVWISLSVKGPVGIPRCSAILIFLSIWLGGVFGGSPRKAVKCCSQLSFRFSLFGFSLFGFRFSADPPLILGRG